MSSKKLIVSRDKVVALLSLHKKIMWLICSLVLSGCLDYGYKESPIIIETEEEKRVFIDTYRQALNRILQLIELKYAIQKTADCQNDSMDAFLQGIAHGYETSCAKEKAEEEAMNAVRVLRAANAQISQAQFLKQQTVQNGINTANNQ